MAAKLPRILTATVAFVALVSGCDSWSATTGTSVASPDTGSATVVQFDPRWMSLAAPPSWRETERRITGEFQQFGLRPLDEDDLPRNCNGCGEDPPTAYLTAYAPGKFDPAAMRSAEPVSVDPDTGGFYRASEASQDAVLAWQYAPDAWATVRGRTSATSEPGRMLELARALRPDDRTAIRVPLGIPDVPPPMKLTELTVVREKYGTTMEFGSCGRTDVGGSRDCWDDAGYLSVQIWPTGDTSGHIDDKGATPGRIGGRDGVYAAGGDSAAVQVTPGMLVVFSLTAPEADLKDILATLTWAPDPADEQTWRPVADWTTPS
jgi:hypothetical protein